LTTIKTTLVQYMDTVVCLNNIFYISLCLSTGFLIFLTTGPSSLYDYRLLSYNKLKTTTLLLLAYTTTPVWLSCVVVSALGIRARGPGFVPLFHWVATLGKLFTHIASPVSQLQETGVQIAVFGA